MTTTTATIIKAPAMNKQKNVHNLDSLQGEICRLKLEVKKIEERLDRNLDYMQDNYWTMMMNSFFFKEGRRKNGGSHFFNHEGFNATINTIAANIADKASEKLHGWMNTFFGK